jgi:hypothetical protein
VARTPSARQRKLVEDGAKGVADRWVGDAGQAAENGVRMRSAVKRFAGKPAEQTEPKAAPQAPARKRSTRAEQAAAGMMAPPPATFDEKAIRSWLDKMSAEDLAKLARLAAIAKAGKEEGRPAWQKVDRDMAQRGMHVEVHGGTVNITNNAAGHAPYNKSHTPYKPQAKRPMDNWGRHLARIKDFING